MSTPSNSAPRSANFTAARTLEDGPVPYLIEPSAQPQGTLVSVHGLSRQSTLQFESMLTLAEALNVTLIAPHFGDTEFSDYQRLGRRGRGPRSDLALLQLLEHLHIGAEAPLLLHGFSGGAQFVHRFVFAHPQRVTRAVLMSAGFYTMLDACTAYPYGLRIGRSLPGVRMQPEAFLRVPTLTIVGAQDTARDASLRTTHGVDARQGCTRVHRAQTWHRELAGMTAALGYPPAHELVEVAGIRHDAPQLIRQSRVAMQRFLAPALTSSATPS